MSSLWRVDSALCPTGLRDMLRHLLSEERRGENQWSTNPFLFFFDTDVHRDLMEKTDLFPSWPRRQRFFGAA
jgi:hypothetical protein